MYHHDQIPTTFYAHLVRPAMFSKKTSQCLYISVHIMILYVKVGWSMSHKHKCVFFGQPVVVDQVYSITLEMPKSHPPYEKFSVWLITHHIIRQLFIATEHFLYNLAEHLNLWFWYWVTLVIVLPTYIYSLLLLFWFIGLFSDWFLCLTKSVCYVCVYIYRKWSLYICILFLRINDRKEFLPHG